MKYVSTETFFSANHMEQNTWPQTKLEGELQWLHTAEDTATEWLKTYGL